MLRSLLMFLVLASCDDVGRHRVLTAFFDGVPPLPGQTSEEGAADPNAIGTGGDTATGGWYVHEPIRDCTQCHARRSRVSFSREVQLVAQAPQLCFKCHEEYVSLPGWVHGPVAAGDCAFCHEPHKTRHRFLLTASVPDLCYRCHDLETLNLIENHAEPSYAQCIKCHDAHAGASRFLLRPAFLEGDAGLSYRQEIQRQQYRQVREMALSDVAQGRGLSDMLRQVTSHMDAGRLWEARAYLEVILEKAVLSADERTAIRDVLSRLVHTIESERNAQTDTAVSDSSSDRGSEALSSELDTVREQRSQQQEALARTYYRSIQLFQAGRLTEAKAGFSELLQSEALPELFRRTAQRYLNEIERIVADVENPN